MKRVSIVICTYNGERYLPRQLETLLGQTYPIYEIIAQDDGSTDRSLSILESYSRRYPIIKVFRNTDERGRGVNSNFLSAIARATGDYIAWSDQDDVWELDKIASQVTLLESEDCDCVTGFSRPFAEEGSVAHFDSRIPNINLIRLMFCGCPGHTLLFRRTLMERLPYEHPIYHVSMCDVAIAIAAAAFDQLRFCNKVLVNHRRHPSAATYTPDIPSASIFSGLHILWWSLRHYRRARFEARRYFLARKLLLERLDSPLPIAREAHTIMQLEMQDGPLSYLKLTYHFVKNHSLLFYTHTNSFVEILRALLYPIMQLYNYRSRLR